MNLFGLILVAVAAPLLVDLLRNPVPDAVAQAGRVAGPALHVRTLRS